MSNDEAKLFEKENRVFKHYINSINRDKDVVGFIQTLFKLELINSDKSEDLDLVQLYNIVGFDAFFELISYFGGTKPIKLPRADKMKKMLIVAIAYYHVIVLGIPPKDVGHILSEKLGVSNLKQKSIKSIINKLQQELETMVSSVENQVEQKGKASYEMVGEV